MSQREENGQTWRGRTATCVNCHTSHTFTGAQLSQDHELCIEMVPCHADDCLAMLCPECPQFVCDCCGLAHCEAHAFRLEFNTSKEEGFCSPCFRMVREVSRCR